MRILLLSPRQSWPLISGARLRDYHIARVLSRYAKVTYVHFTDSDSPISLGLHLPLAQQVLSVPRDRSYRPTSVMRGLIGGTPLPLLNYDQHGMHALLSKLLQESSFDMAHLDSIHMQPYVELLRRHGLTKIVWNWHNIESELLLRYARNETNIPRKAYAALTARRLAKIERRNLSESTGHLVCSERERRQLLAMTPEASIAVIPNGVDVSYYTACGEGPAAKQFRLVYVGSMDYHANIEAMLTFVDSVWPMIHETHPELRLTIVGSKPVPAIVSLAKRSGIEVTGTVEDVRPFYREAMAMVVPLLTGSGTRLKILEAMAAGVPVLSTSLGAEGLDVEHGREILIANQPEEWLAMLQRLANPEQRRDLIQRGFTFVKAKHDWDALGEQVFRTYQKWMA